MLDPELDEPDAIVEAGTCAPCDVNAFDPELAELAAIVGTAACAPCEANAFDPELDELVAIVETDTCGPFAALLVIVSIQPTGGGHSCKPGGNNSAPTGRE